jgi:cytochrome c peroxidase
MNKLYFFFFLIACFTTSCFYFEKNNTVEKNNALENLGKKFFFDTRLSQNNTKSCATCHAPQFAFTDGYRKSSGIYADETKRNAPTLLNTRFLKSLTWADDVKSYQAQILKPLFSKHPVEMGLDSTDFSILKRFQNDTAYQFLFKKVYKKNIQYLNYQDIINAIAAYENTLVRFESQYDKGNYISEIGKQLFFSKKFQCNTCHTAPLFTTGKMAKSFISDNDNGFFDKTKNENDLGKFRIPTLRNVELTAPYMHDGSVERLEIAIQHDFFNKKNKKINPVMDKKEVLELMIFLKSLTDVVE